MNDTAEDLTVLLEYMSDIYQQCSHNETVIKLLTNALLHYCYLPLVIPALVGTAHKVSTQIGISTALFAATLTFKQLKSKEIQNCLALILISNKIP